MNIFDMSYAAAMVTGSPEDMVICVCYLKNSDHITREEVGDLHKKLYLVHRYGFELEVRPAPKNPEMGLPIYNFGSNFICLPISSRGDWRELKPFVEADGKKFKLNSNGLEVLRYLDTVLGKFDERKSESARWPVYIDNDKSRDLSRPDGAAGHSEQNLPGLTAA